MSLPSQGGSGDLDSSHCAFEPEEDLQNDLLYDIFVQIVAGIMRDSPPHYNCQSKVSITTTMIIASSSLHSL
ncbi:BQ5605_C004g03123 [Microbotryum silenes-dioicae]|uniref:BQ5605_C004g03123 protein n=1 Tax=Microbotryum silenes-dioicae TaxID=796604 RepID=A0A2X0M9W8_9BASI|nr:BQ5605_C004g03123 [Microbotryum silenes-dioicae]